jgi:predicted signal transduction protein with EAL and GGDEF domain
VIPARARLLSPDQNAAAAAADGADGETLIKNADIAMYQAKEKGKNNYQIYDLEMDMRIVRKLKLESSLRHAIRHEELSVHYQPIVNINSGIIIGMEALLRWKHPQIGYISPMDFIPLAEETGLIVPIGNFVLRTACKQNKAWQDAGYSPLRMSVNMSARQFQQQNLIEEIQTILSETGLEPQWLSIEITEGVAIQDLDLTISTIEKLRDMGVEAVLDDFGTGYLSLNNLKKLPIRKLKIDRALVREILSDVCSSDLRGGPTPAGPGPTARAPTPPSGRAGPAACG